MGKKSIKPLYLKWLVLISTCSNLPKGYLILCYRINGSQEKTQYAKLQSL